MELVNDLVIWSVGDGVVWPALPLVYQHAFSLLLRVGVAERSFGREPITAARD
jgi:hypothetical protein